MMVAESPTRMSMLHHSVAVIVPAPVTGRDYHLSVTCDAVFEMSLQSN